MVCDRNAQEQRVQHGSVRDFPQPPSQCANDAHQEADYPQCSRQQSSRQEDTGEQDCRKRVDRRQASCQQEANKYGFWQHSLYEHDLLRLQQLVVRTPESSSLSAINAKRAHDLATVLNMDNPDPSSLCLKCPAPSCRTTFPETTTYRGFEEHTRRHNLEFFRIDLHVCPFGCQLGIFDTIQQYIHIDSCPRTSTVDPNASPPKFTYNDCACHTLVGPPPFLIIGLSWLDSVTFLRHVLGSDPNSPQHVETLLHQYDPSSFIVYQHTNDILRSSVLCPEPEVHYDLQALECRFITQQDLQILGMQQLAKSQIIYSIMQGLCPVLVPMSVNAMSQHWERLCLYTYQFNIEYGPLNVWLRISQEEAEDVGKYTSTGSLSSTTRQWTYWLLYPY
ncbi:hypothetical protein KCU65_g10127, partial [Aureobasidium melanogenum]